MDLAPGFLPKSVAARRIPGCIHHTAGFPAVAPDPLQVGSPPVPFVGF
jgi:hypothetical protein